MPIVNTCLYYMGSMGPLALQQHAFFSALRVQCVRFTLSDSPIRTVT